MKYRILVGASVICWAVWLTLSDILFDKVLAPSYLQITFSRVTRYWFLLQKEEDRQLMKVGFIIIETAVMEIFARYGWRFSNRIAH